MSRNSNPHQNYLEPGRPKEQPPSGREKNPGPLRVMVVGPIYGGSVPISRYVRTAFQNLGHNVLYNDNTDFCRRLKCIQNEPNPEQRTILLNRLTTDATTRTVLAARQQRTQLLFVMAQAPVSINGIRVLRESGAVTAFWFVENYRALPYWKSIASEYDFFFSIQKGDFFAELEQLDTPNFAYVPTGCDPSVHKPVPMDTQENKEFKVDISIAGAPYPNRVRLLQEINSACPKTPRSSSEMNPRFRPKTGTFPIEIGTRCPFSGVFGQTLNIGMIDLWGEGWNTREIPGTRVRKNGKRFDTEEMVRVYSGTCISINHHSSLLAEVFDPQPDFLNPRLFECAAVGGFQLVDYRDELHRMYKPGEEIVSYHSTEELVHQIHYYLARQDERIQIALRARERAIRDHTYERRISEILDYIAVYAGSKLQTGGVRTDITSPVLQLGVTVHREGNIGSAEQLYRAVLDEVPNDGDAMHLLGVACAQQGLPHKALPYLRSAVDSKPQSPPFLYDYATALRKCGNIPEAAVWFRKLLTVSPAYAPAYAGLGELFVSTGSLKPARDALKTALRLLPEAHEQRIALGNVHRELGELSAAEIQYRSYLNAHPDDAVGLNNLALCLVEQGKIHEATLMYKRALRQKPNSPSIISNFLFAQCYEPSHSPETLADLHRRCAGEIEAQTTARAMSIASHDHTVLRVGLVSADFRSHSVAYFLESLLSNGNTTRLRFFAYSDTRLPDDTTIRLRNYCHRWREISDMSDEQVANLVARDEIDILIDLAGHTSGNRLTLFARRPAATQVTWLGYPFTTGLSCMDYRITDFFADPPGSEHVYSETLLRLSPSFLCYTPPKSSPSPEYPHPSERNEFVMGSFNAVPKLNNEIVDLWAQALSTIPGSKLLLKHKSFNDSQVERDFRKRFAAYGLNEDRIEIRNYNELPSDHLCVYRELDVALDPFPYNGTTTTCEALWMGVPVVTLAGDRHSGRVGVSILTNTGLDELIATTPEEYIAILVNMSRNHDYLYRLHSRAGQALSTSPVCDCDLFAREFEKAMLNIHTGTLQSPAGERHE